MSTVQLTLSETTYSGLHEAAERRSQPIEGLLEDALSAFLQPTTSAETSSGNGSSESAVGWRQAKIRAEARAWRSMPPAVQRSFGDDSLDILASIQTALERINRRFRGIKEPNDFVFTGPGIPPGSMGVSQ
jgi:hypothetical protein